MAWMHRVLPGEGEERADTSLSHVELGVQFKGQSSRWIKISLVEGSSGAVVTPIPLCWVLHVPTGAGSPCLEEPTACVEEASVPPCYCWGMEAWGD